jgi:hypothetical protein
MTRQLLRACFCAVALLGAPALAPLAAKPPDLPVNDKDTVKPQTPAGSEDPADQSPSESVRKAVQGSGGALRGVAGDESETTPAGTLLFGVGASGDAGLIGGAIMEPVMEPAWDPSFVPLPPLVWNPLNDAGMVAFPPVNDPQPLSALSRLEPTVRRNLASSLLFAVHPLLTLTPTDQLLDCPSDHPQPAVAGEIFAEVEVSETGTGSLLFRLGVRGDAGLTGSIMLNDRDCWALFLRRCAGLLAQTPGEKPCNFINAFEPATFIKGLTPADTREGGPGAGATPGPEPIEKMPAEDDDGPSGEVPTCPHLRQQAAGRHAQQLADPEVGGDVMSNLERLLEADRLLETGRELARQGHVCEALDCFGKIEQTCPGCYDERITDVLADIFSGVYDGAPEAQENGGEGTPDKASRAEDVRQPPCPKCEKMHAERAGVQEQVIGLMKACHLAMSAGRTGRAAALAREAYALDPQRVTADPLVYKTHLLALKQDRPRSDRPARKSRPSKRPAPVALVCPPLPVIDPQVPAALDRVLAEAEEQQDPSGAKADPLPYPLCEEPGEADYPHGDCSAKDAGVSGTSLLEEFLDGLAPDMPAGSHFELGVTWGAVSLSCEVPAGGAVYHVFYNKGALAVWMTPDPSAGEKSADGPR